MEPESSGPHPQPEVGQINNRIEAPSFSGQNNEVAPVQVPERSGRIETREILPAPTNAGQPAYVAPSVPAPQVPVVAPVQPALPASQPVDDNPVAAGDDDLIEKAWVDKAKKIIASTRDDPYMQEKEVSKLQADYLKKRYGKDIKMPTE